jgi:hypothetical protein
VATAANPWNADHSVDRPLNQRGAFREGRGDRRFVAISTIASRAWRMLR